MKRKITIALGIYFLIFFLGGLYIITTIEDSTSRLHHLIRLYQVEILRERLLIRIRYRYRECKIFRQDIQRLFSVSSS
ncbi:MAG: hypothetical protein JRH18_15890 [Deltaproteobacteria bacterium]|nr:hypothetical protein [Deltaproteobacteria bacterium]